MSAMKGRSPRPRRRDEEDRPRHQANMRLEVDALKRLDRGAAALKISRVAYVELLARRMPLNERGLPPWLADMDTGQRALDLAS